RRVEVDRVQAHAVAAHDPEVRARAKDGVVATWTRAEENAFRLPRQLDHGLGLLVRRDDDARLGFQLRHAGRVDLAGDHDQGAGGSGHRAASPFTRIAINPRVADDRPSVPASRTPCYASTEAARDRSRHGRERRLTAAW